MTGRDETLERLREPHDILVIGGGVTGAGILAEAAHRGLRAVLVERGDFASATSSRSSKLVHGGLRYLRQGHIALTRESVHERETLLREAPGLVEPMPFLMPHYRGRKPGRVMTELGLRLYDALAGRGGHRALGADEALNLAPLLAERDLTGAHLFMDATTDDARLVLRLLQEAEEAGAAALNYAQATLVRNATGVRGAIVGDRVSGREIAVSARVVINATGVFSDALRSQVGGAPKLRPLRGSHILTAHWRLPLAQAVTFAHPRDGRSVFAYPWMGTTLVGTTDLDHDRDLREEPCIAPQEVTYLLEALDEQFPRSPIRRADILSTFAGVRPVIAGGKAAPSSESREQLLLCEDGLVTIAGGKLTTFRPMALAALRSAAVQLGGSIDLRSRALFAQGDASPSRRLNGRYGRMAPRVLSAAADTSEHEPIGTSQTTWAEVRYAARVEKVVHLEDLLMRRTRLGLQLAGGGAHIMERVGAICAQELGWDDARWNAELRAYRALVERCYGVPV